MGMIMDNEKSLVKLEEICSKEENIRKILQAKTKDDIKPLFEEKGIELTDERFEILKKVYTEIAEKLRNMSEEELNKISAGKWVNTKLGTGLGLIYGTAVGTYWSGGRVLAEFLINSFSEHSDRGDDFWQWVKTAIANTAVTALCGACLGGTLGGVSGLGADLITGGDTYLDLDKKCKKS